MIQPVSMDTYLGRKLRDERLARHLSVRQLHLETGVAQATIREIEAGDRDPFDHTVSKLAEFFGLTVDELRGSAA